MLWEGQFLHTSKPTSSRTTTCLYSAIKQNNFPCNDLMANEQRLKIFSCFRRVHFFQEGGKWGGKGAALGGSRLKKGGQRCQRERFCCFTAVSVCCCVRKRENNSFLDSILQQSTCFPTSKILNSELILSTLYSQKVKSNIMTAF